MNAIALLKADHRTVEDLFDQITRLDGKPAGKKALVEKLVRELSIHAAIEEQLFYPEAKEDVPGARELVLESLEEHNIVKWELDALLKMDPNDEHYDAKIKVLRDNVMHHVEMEENELFPRVRDALGMARLNELGTELERAKRIAPTRPHPRAPNEPPGNFVVGMGAAVMDRAREAARDLLRRRGERKERTPAKREAAAPKRRATAKRRAGAKRARSQRASARAERR